MLNSAEKIEKIMELTLLLNEDIAEKEACLNELTEKLSILNTLKEVNYYMGAELELDKILQIIIDVVMGVLGVSVCSICLIKGGEWEINEHSVLSKDFNKIVTPLIIETILDILKEKNGHIIIHDLSVSSFIDLKEGSFIAFPLNRGTNNFGFITIYYNHPGSLSDAKIEFFKLISAQLGIHLENGYLYEKVKLASISDGLTGLYNRLHLNEMLHKRGMEALSGCGIIMMDIDNFKKINDTYGHMFGDTVLKELALVLKRIQRDYGVTVFRYGGEEFIVLCSGLGIESICDIAERIRTGFSSLEFETDGGKTSFTLSLGVSLFGYSSKITDVSILLDTADNALYFSKKSGKNKYTVSCGELQLLQGAMESINKMIARFARFGKTFTIVKIKYSFDGVISKHDYFELIDKVTNSFRVYDQVFYNNLGEFIGILEDYVEMDVIRGRLIDNLQIIDDSFLQIESIIYNGEMDVLDIIFDMPREMVDKFVVG